MREREAEGGAAAVPRGRSCGGAGSVLGSGREVEAQMV